MRKGVFGCLYCVISENVEILIIKIHRNIEKKFIYIYIYIYIYAFFFKCLSFYLQIYISFVFNYYII